MKRNGFVDFILSLEDEINLGKFNIKKKFLVVGVLGLVIYALISAYSINSPRITDIGEKGDTKQNKNISEKKEESEIEMKSFSEKESNTKSYEENMNEILSMSDDEIRELLKSQNMYLSDEDIAKFREDVRKNMPKTQEEAMKNAEEFKNFEETTMKQVYEEAKKMAEEETKKKGE
jgi:hypothetical protein